jgi:hypothetical protein
MTGETLIGPGFPVDEVRERARRGAEAIFPAPGGSTGAAYGNAVFGQVAASEPVDGLDVARIAQPVLMPGRLERLLELGREPAFPDVELGGPLGGFRSPLPVYVSAMGSTSVAQSDVGSRMAVQAARAGLPLVLGENIRSVFGYDRRADPLLPSFKERAMAYVEAATGGEGGLVVQQSTEDANAELWNEVYSDPDFHALLRRGLLGFELKLGQGAKGATGGMTLVDRETAERLGTAYRLESLDGARWLRSSAPGTFTEDILRSQVRLMRNNYPGVRVWAKLPPGRDVRVAAEAAWSGGADAVAVDGACGGTGLTATVLLQHLGLPLDECLRRFDGHRGELLVSGRMWEGGRAVKALALGASGIGLGRAAIIAASEDAEMGLVRLVEALAMEMRLLISACGKYRPAHLGPEDVWFGGGR